MKKVKYVYIRKDNDHLKEQNDIINKMKNFHLILFSNEVKQRFGKYYNKLVFEKPENKENL
jgi:hypothetical protein